MWSYKNTLGLSSAVVEIHDARRQSSCLADSDENMISRLFTDVTLGGQTGNAAPVTEEQAREGLAASVRNYTLTKKQTN